MISTYGVGCRAYNTECNTDSNRELINSYQRALEGALKTKINKYRGRASREKKHIDSTKAITVMGSTTGFGASVGTVFPGPGNAIGAAAGAVVGGLILSGIKVHHARENHKIDSAERVSTFFTREHENSIIQIAARKIISERAIAIQNLYNPEGEKEKIANYLAKNALFSIKSKSKVSIDTKSESKSTWLSQHVNHSRKRSLCQHLKIRDKEVNKKHPYTLDGLAENIKCKYKTSMR